MVSIDWVGGCGGGRDGWTFEGDWTNCDGVVSLGKSSSAALERLCQQTEVLVNDLSEEGGAGAFINVRRDFLR